MIRRRIPALFSSLITALLLSAGTPAFSQGQWVDDLYLVGNTVDDKNYKTAQNGYYFHRYAFIDEKNVIQETIPSLKEATDFPIESTFLNWSPKQFWLNDALYAMASGRYTREKDGLLSKPWTFAKWQEKKWHYLGQFKHVLPAHVEYSELRAFPCDNDKFIVVSRTHDLASDKGSSPSPFAVLSIRPNTKEAVVDRSLYHGIDELKDYMSDQKFFGLACNASFIVTGKYATIINELTGLYWCFSLEKAALTKAGCIFKGIRPDEMLKTISKGGFSMAVLCANPEKDGTVLVSASEEAALRGEVGDKWDEIRQMMEENSNLSQAEAEKLFLKHQEALAKRNPWVVWYRIYPENGRIEKLPQPPIGGANKKKGALANLMALGTANDWRPMPDGSVVMGEVKPKAPKQSASK